MKFTNHEIHDKRKFGISGKEKGQKGEQKLDKYGRPFSLIFLIVWDNWIKNCNLSDVILNVFKGNVYDNKFVKKDGKKT